MRKDAQQKFYLFLPPTNYFSDFVQLFTISVSKLKQLCFSIMPFHESSRNKSSIFHNYNINSYLKLNTHFPELLACLSFIFCILESLDFVLLFSQDMSKKNLKANTLYHFRDFLIHYEHEFKILIQLGGRAEVSFITPVPYEFAL